MVLGVAFPPLFFDDAAQLGRIAQRDKWGVAAHSDDWATRTAPSPFL